MAVSFDEATRRLIDGKNFATIATIGPAGEPQASVVWVARAGDTLIFSTKEGRQKAHSLAREPRVSVAIFANENPHQSVEIRGRAKLVEDPEKALPKTLSQQYLGTDPPLEEPGWRRLIVRIISERVIQLDA